MSGRSLWTRIVAGTACAAVTVILVPVPAPLGVRTGTLAALVAGLAAGAVVFVVVAGSRPRLPGRSTLTPAQLLFILGWAWVEEALWRRLLLGGVAVALGAFAGLVVATALFAVAHRHGRRAQLVAGAGFGAAYIATGRLGAAVASHVVYNLLVAGSREPNPVR